MGQWHVMLNDRILERFWVEEGDTITVGRGKSVDVSLDNRAVSRNHAQIVMREGRYYVIDAGSTNGTRLNGKKVTGKAPVALSDHVAIAKFCLMPASSHGDTYPPYAMVRESDVAFHSLSELPEDFEGTVFVASRKLVVLGSASSPRSFALKDRSKVTIGKDENCHIRITGQGIGTHQCTVLTKADKHYIVHQSGWKRTKVNGKKVKDQQLLRKGDVIGIGKYKIRYM